MAKIKQDENITASAAPQEQGPNFDVIIERLEKLETENRDLKQQQEHPMQKAKEKYDWPRAYSYKKWWGVPVLGYTSVKRDDTKDLIYKGANGQFVDNHLLKLQLADGKSPRVEVIEFNNSFVRSDKIVPKAIITTPDGMKGYQFEDKEYGEFVVLESMIN